MNRQGTAIIERQRGRRALVMLPDGSVHRLQVKEIPNFLRYWARMNARGFSESMLVVEWRGWKKLPASLVNGEDSDRE